MKVAYVDTSWLVALAFDEPGGRPLTPEIERILRVRYLPLGFGRPST